jgi:hypothetical protein
MMKPKEKAYELVSKFNFEHTGETYIIHQTVDESKRCAIIAVDEIINNCLFENYSCGFLLLETKHKEYWLKVKDELMKL